jgi:hypothetical protein
VIQLRRSLTGWTPPGYYVPTERGDARDGCASPTCAHCGEQPVHHIGPLLMCPAAPLEVSA